MTDREPSAFFERVRFRGHPIANPDSVAVSQRAGEGGRARFTALTPRLLRMEWSEIGEFEDRGSYAFPTRYAPAPPLSIRSEGPSRVLDTGALTLRYQEGNGRFRDGNLSIQFELNGEPHTWTPGTPNPHNLRGTRRTLDGCTGDAALEQGILSRAGWSLFDDSRSVLFDPADGWVCPRPEHQLQDWYFFGYGHDYKGALADYIRFGGPVTLIPRYVLGAWWSRYWAYSDQDLKDLVDDFARYDLPLDVLVVDMDWHTPHAWTGYTWNRELFPDPPAFLQWVHDKGLRATLNLHPAQGVQAFEEVYPLFAEAMGLDPQSGQAVPFQIADKRFARHYFQLLHHPMEDDGVDFWWIDWQQGETSEVKGLDPLLWLNHLHFADSARRGRRPLIYSRWGGLGNHRYQTGFSGDTWVGWPALQFQPYFTAAASNVAYGWWGHDIGGHMGGATEPELYARWVQYGALSPSLRLHATKDPLAERRPWKYPDPVYRAARDAFHLRYQLVPYIYTMARIAHDTGLSLCRPMYYEYPEDEAAYAGRYQYFFGDQMIAAPIVHPADPQTGMAAIDVWLPEGAWIDYQTKETYTGPRWIRLVGDLDRIPALVRAGTILPLAAPFETPDPTHLTSGTTESTPRDRLILSVFPGDEGSFRLYEDDGISEEYQQGQCEWTQIATRMDDPGTWTVHVAPVEGRCQALPGRRSYEIRLEGSHRPDRVAIDGFEITGWTYDEAKLRAIIPVPAWDKGQSLTILATARGGISALGVDHNRHQILSDVRRLLGDASAGIECESELLDLALQSNLPGRLDAIARLGGPFVHIVEFTTPEEASLQLGRTIVGAPAPGSEPYDLKATWTLHRAGQVEEHTTRAAGVTESLILDAPFAFDGQVQAAHWTVEVHLAWKGATLTYRHESQPLFPSIYAWQALVYDPEAQSLAAEQVLDRKDTGHPGLDWQSHVQTAEGLKNINEPHGVFLSREYKKELEQGTPLAAYLTTTIRCPDQREAVLRFRCAGLVDFYLNGSKVEEVPVEQEDWLPALLRKTRRTAVMHLDPGENRLLVHTRPPEDKRPWWYLGGALTTSAGEIMTDLAYT